MEIYLTKMILNPRCQQVKIDLGNPQELHKTVSSGFPKVENQEHLPKHLRETPRNKYNILHRLEVDRRRGKAVLLVQATTKPDWSFLSDDYAQEIHCKAVHDIYSKIRKGMQFAFRVRANPSKRDKSKFDPFKPTQRKRVALVTDEERIEWLNRQGFRTGFRLTGVKIAPPVSGDPNQSDELVMAPALHNVAPVEAGLIKFRKREGEKSESVHLISYGSVLFEGVLQVTKADDFIKKALREGIGQGKAYGFGLLSIAPVKAN